ncbi:unnamed protein product [Brassicogethes aeneus]|uniref:Uncharacterized protein n=1 Tax=Brassicogethes aeneus TaxID=1431903 RepID=A0A9P0AVX9_BRAAE|nr:unnamed protein product [Brassicogethes aeneus]
MKSVCIFVLCSVGLCYSSAIPVWELLKKEEKKSFIYSLFAKEVENYCELLKVKSCNTDLLKYGLDRIDSLSELELDSLDPYQREADDLIWNTILLGNKHQKTTVQPKTSTTPKPNSYEDNIFSDNFGFDDIQENSPKYENFQYMIPPEGLIVKLDEISPIMSQLYKLNSYINVKDIQNKKDDQSITFIGFKIPEISEEKEHSRKEKSDEIKILPNDDGFDDFIFKIKPPKA